MNRAVLLFALSFLVAGCPHDWPPVDPDPGPTSTVTPMPGPDPVLEPGVDADEAACERLKFLSCKSRDGRDLWKATPGGVSCPDVFRNAAKNDIDLHPACIAKIEKCEERHACTAKD